MYDNQNYDCPRFLKYMQPIPTLDLEHCEYNAKGPLRNMFLLSFGQGLVIIPIVLCGV